MHSLLRTLAALALTGALMGLALALAGRLSLSPHADIAAHFTLHLMVVAGAALTALVARRGAFLILCCGAALTLALHPLLALSGGVPFPGSGAQATSGDGRPVKVVSFNIWHANTEIGAIEALLQREDADFALLYEVGPEHATLIDRLRPLYPHANGCHDSYRCGVVVLSRKAPASAEVRGYGHHGDPPLVATRFGSGPGSLTVIAAHLIRPIDSARNHWSEIDRLAELARAAAGAVIVAGDFNATPWSGSFARFRERSGLKHMGAYLPSWPAGPRGYPQLAIDHVWASQGVAFTGIEIGPDTGSDHRPLIARLTLPASVTGYR
jgi:endonuclease/exonuclease/phosphatase (EEP) superfamily protein YafD